LRYPLTIPSKYPPLTLKNMPSMLAKGTAAEAGYDT
jgi:hypothetical protein